MWLHLELHCTLRLKFCYLWRRLITRKRWLKECERFSVFSKFFYLFYFSFVILAHFFDWCPLEMNPDNSVSLLNYYIYVTFWSICTLMTLYSAAQYVTVLVITYLQIYILCTKYKWFLMLFTKVSFLFKTSSDSIVFWQHCLFTLLILLPPQLFLFGFLSVVLVLQPSVCGHRHTPCRLTHTQQLHHRHFLQVFFFSTLNLIYMK